MRSVSVSGRTGGIRTPSSRKRVVERLTERARAHDIVERATDEPRRPPRAELDCEIRRTSGRDPDPDEIDRSSAARARARRRAGARARCRAGRAEHPDATARRTRHVRTGAADRACATTGGAGRARETAGRAPRPDTRRAADERERGHAPPHDAREQPDHEEAPRTQDAPHPPDAERLETDADDDAHPARLVASERVKRVPVGERRPREVRRSGIPPTTTADIRAWADSACAFGRHREAIAQRRRESPRARRPTDRPRPRTSRARPRPPRCPARRASRAHARERVGERRAEPERARRTRRSRPRAAPSPRATAVTAVAIVPPARSSDATWSTVGARPTATIRARRPRADAATPVRLPPPTSVRRRDRPAPRRARRRGCAAVAIAANHSCSAAPAPTVSPARSSATASRRSSRAGTRRGARDARAGSRSATAKRRAARVAPATSTDTERADGERHEQRGAHARHTSSRSIPAAPGRTLGRVHAHDRPPATRSSSEPGARHPPRADLATRRPPRAARRVRARPARSRRPRRASWARIAASGRATPESKASVSSRASASAGELACTVDSEPSWPVLHACSMSSASPPRTSPTTSRSGRMRSAARDELAHARPRPRLRRSRAGLRAARRGAGPAAAPRSPRSSRCVPRDRSPAASALQHVVLPALVAPDTTMFQPARTIASRNATARHRRARTSSSGTARPPKRRIVTHGPSGASGGSTACSARAVGQAGVDHRRRAVEAQPERRDHPLHDPHDRRRVDARTRRRSMRPARST